MDKRPKLLVIEEDKTQTKDQLGVRIYKRRILNVLSAAGIKVLHDSGGRLIIIDVPEKIEKTLLKNIPGAKLISINPDMKDDISGLNTNESFFLV
jgi:hypothetical protein